MLHFSRVASGANDGAYRSDGRYAYRINRTGRRWVLEICICDNGPNLHRQAYPTKRAAESVANQWEGS